MQKRFVIACVLISVLLTGCATNSAGKTFCDIYNPVYTGADTEETLKQIDDNNAVYSELCM